MTDENSLPPVLEPEVLPESRSESDRSWAGVTSLIFGIINLVAWCLPFCGGPMSVIGIIIGALGLKAPNRGMAIAGIVLNIIGLILSIIAAILFFSLWSAGWFENFGPGMWNFQ